MASNFNDKLDPKEEEEMRKQMEDLQLQQKRMKSLVDQRRQERLDMEKELLRMERMKKHMEDMCKENDEVLAAERKLEESKKPFSGKGQMLGAPSSISSPPTNLSSRPIVPAPPPVDVNPDLPTTNIQVNSTILNMTLKYISFFNNLTNKFNLTHMRGFISG